MTPGGVLCLFPSPCTFRGTTMTCGSSTKRGSRCAGGFAGGGGQARTHRESASAENIVNASATATLEPPVLPLKTKGPCILPSPPQPTAAGVPRAHEGRPATAASRGDPRVLILVALYCGIPARTKLTHCIRGIKDQGRRKDDLKGRLRAMSLPRRRESRHRPTHYFRASIVGHQRKKRLKKNIPWRVVVVVVSV